VSLSFIGQLDRTNQEIIHALAVSSDGEHTKTFSYSLKDSPCEEVVGQDFCYHSSGIKQKFPNDAVLIGMDVESYMGIPLWSASGKPLGLIVLMHKEKFPNRDYAESVLRLVALRAAAELERKISDEEQEALQEKMLDAQKLESLGVLAGGIAHDFNNLLTSIMGNTNIAMRKLPPDTPVRDLLEKIEQSAEKAAVLTEQMLAYSGKSMVKEEVLSLDDLVRDMKGLINASVSRKVQVELSLHKAVIEGDSSQIQQVIINLVRNSSEAIGERDGSIKIRTGECWMESEQLNAASGKKLPSGEYCFIEVNDDGDGIDPSFVARIFDPFFTTKFTGRGLGLAASYGIIRSHGGAITVASDPGTTTSIKIFLPQSSAKKLAKPRLIVDNTDEAKGTVLVVDDEPDLRDIASLALAAQDFYVLTAEDGNIALEIFKQNKDKIQAVLLDFTMPGLSGLEVLEQLHELAPDLPVIIMSGYTAQEVGERCEHLKPTGVIQKPFLPDDLGSQLTDFLVKENVN